MRICYCHLVASLTYSANNMPNVVNMTSQYQDEVLRTEPHLLLHVQLLDISRQAIDVPLIH